MVWSGQNLELALESLKERFQKDVTPLDVVTGIVYFFKKDEFSTDYGKLHKAFYKVRGNGFLKEFTFRKGGPYPYSELLENVFARMAISGLLGCQNPDYRQFTITREQRKRIREGLLKKFSRSQKKELKSLSLKIQKKLL